MPQALGGPALVPRGGGSPGPSLAVCRLASRCLVRIIVALAAMLWEPLHPSAHAPGYGCRPRGSQPTRTLVSGAICGRCIGRADQWSALPVRGRAGQLALASKFLRLSAGRPGFAATLGRKSTCKAVGARVAPRSKPAHAPHTCRRRPRDPCPWPGAYAGVRASRPAAARSGRRLDV